MLSTIYLYILYPIHSEHSLTTNPFYSTLPGLELSIMGTIYTYLARALDHSTMHTHNFQKEILIILNIHFTPSHDIDIYYFCKVF